MWASVAARLSTRKGGGNGAADGWPGSTSEVPRWEQDWRLHVLKREEAQERWVRIQRAINAKRIVHKGEAVTAEATRG